MCGGGMSEGREGASFHAYHPTHDVARPKLDRWFGGGLDKIQRIRDGVDKT
jgi:hypothetical protein